MARHAPSGRDLEVGHDALAVVATVRELRTRAASQGSGCGPAHEAAIGTAHRQALGPPVLGGARALAQQVQLVLRRHRRSHGEQKLLTEAALASETLEDADFRIIWVSVLTAKQ